MLAYLAALTVCLPSIVLALAMSTCPRDQSLLFFDPTKRRCDASYLLACLIGCLCLVYVLIWVLQNPPAPAAAAPGCGRGGRGGAGKAAPPPPAADPFGLPPLPPLDAFSTAMPGTSS